MEYRIHDCFDLVQFSSAPQSDLRSFYPGPVGEGEAGSLDLTNVVSDANRLLASDDVRRVTTVPEIADLRTYLDQDFLILCNVTYHLLTGGPFESMHSV